MKIRVIEQINPFLLDEQKRYELEHIESINDIIELRKLTFNYPTVCFVNNQPVLRKDWHESILKHDDIVCFIAQPQGPAIAAAAAFLKAHWIATTLVVASIAAAVTMTPPAIGDTPEANPMYSLDGQNNQIKLNNPIEVAYGRNKLWPSYAARPFTRYVGNDQYLYQLLCLGQGKFDVEGVYIEDTPIESFGDTIEYEIYEPNEKPSLFAANVTTSVEVNNIELEHNVYTSTYVANASGTDAVILEIDMIFPTGIYYRDSKGGTWSLYAGALFEYQEINDAGTPVGSWQTLYEYDQESYSLDPLRLTFQKTVTAGRYQVRAKRTNPDSTSAKDQDTIIWGGLRAVITGEGDYGNVTLIAIKSKATNNLNSNSSNRFGVICTRKLEIYDAETETWSTETATRNPVWAFCDAAKADYGAKLTDVYLDLVGLSLIAEDLETQELFFDWVFDQKSTLWERVFAVLPMLILQCKVLDYQ